LCFDPDGERIAVHFGTGIIIRKLEAAKSVIDCFVYDSNGSGLKGFRPSNLIFSRDGKWLLGSGKEGLMICDSATGELIRKIPDTEYSRIT
jgi:hypothetical protein